MSIQKIMFVAIIAAGGIGAFTMPATSQAGVHADVIIRVAPPPLPVEVIPQPRYGYVWVPGYWNWAHHRHVWVAGNWARERRGYVYAPHRWEQRGEGWYMNRGHWDRDGGRHEGHRDNPYRR